MKHPPSSNKFTGINFLDTTVSLENTKKDDKDHLFVY